jgi:hypothetical protein
VAETETPTLISASASEDIAARTASVSFFTIVITPRIQRERRIFYHAAPGLFDQKQRATTE